MGKCWPRKNFTRYFVDEYGSVSGADNMKKEILKRGPIGKKTSSSTFSSYTLTAV